VLAFNCLIYFPDYKCWGIEDPQPHPHALSAINYQLAS